MRDATLPHLILYLTFLDLNILRRSLTRIFANDKFGKGKS